MRLRHLRERRPGRHDPRGEQAGGGARPGVIGMGIYLIWPAFFTNVTDSYRLSRAGNRDTPALGTFRTVARAADVGGTYTFKAARLTKGRYVLIWFTKLPPAGTGQFAAEVFGVTVRGWS